MSIHTTGDWATASTTGDWATASTTGHGATASTTGHGATASTTGDGATASTTGHRATASTTGDGATASTTGHRATASTTGYGATASTTGYGATASTTGHRATASTTGYGATASTTGDWATAMSVQGAAQTEGVGSVAVGRWVRLTDNGMDAVVLPTPGHQPFIVSISDGWPTWQWISMDDYGNVTASESLLLANDGRGYSLEWLGKYVAGCRRFTYTEAVAHWSDPDHEDPAAAARLLAEVERHHNQPKEGTPK